PSVILPPDWRQWTIGTRRAVLAHEFAHIRRNDLLTRRLAHFARCVFWFNPLAWWLSRRLSQLAEMACDAAALEAANDPVAYSRMLVEFAGRVNQAGHRVAAPGLAMIASSGLGERIDKVFATSSGAMRRLTRPGIVLLLAGVPIVGAVAAIGLTESV